MSQTDDEIVKIIYKICVDDGIKFYDSFCVLSCELSDSIGKHGIIKYIDIYKIYTTFDGFSGSILISCDRKPNTPSWVLCRYDFNIKECDKMRNILAKASKMVLNHFIPYIEKVQNAKLDKLKRLAAIDDKLQAIVYAPDSSLFQEIKTERDKLVEKLNPV